MLATEGSTSRRGMVACNGSQPPGLCDAQPRHDGGSFGFSLSSVLNLLLSRRCDGGDPWAGQRWSWLGLIGNPTGRECAKAEVVL